METNRCFCKIMKLVNQKKGKEDSLRVSFQIIEMYAKHTLAGALKRAGRDKYGDSNKRVADWLWN